MKNTPLLTTQQLAVNIADNKICQQLNLTINYGECWAILGQNGTGKTTLLHSLAGLLDIDDGKILLKNKSLNTLSKKNIAQQIGLLLQDQQDVFPATIMESVLIGRHPHMSIWQWESEQDHQLSMQALNDVDLTHMEKRLLQTLSGGERRRVAIATILAQQPELFLLDEPVNHMDIKHQHHILNLFAEKSRSQHHATVMVLHDVNLAARYCSHVLMLYGDGKTEMGTAEEMLTAEKLSGLYDYPIEKYQQDQQHFFKPL